MIFNNDLLNLILLLILFKIFYYYNNRHNTSKANKKTIRLDKYNNVEKFENKYKIDEKK